MISNLPYLEIQPMSSKYCTRPPSECGFTRNFFVLPHFLVNILRQPCQYLSWYSALILYTLSHCHVLPKMTSPVFISVLFLIYSFPIPRVYLVVSPRCCSYILWERHDWPISSWIRYSSIHSNQGTYGSLALLKTGRINFCSTALRFALSNITSCSDDGWGKHSECSAARLVSNCVCCVWPSRCLFVCLFVCLCVYWPIDVQKQSSPNITQKLINWLDFQDHWVKGQRQTTTTFKILWTLHLVFILLNGWICLHGVLD